MDRILVIGCPGSGKSYFSKMLGSKLDLPVIHMDNLYWSKDKKCCSKDELINKLKPIIKESHWIIDGNYHQTLDYRLSRATDVFFLDLPRQQCIDGMIERIGKLRDDIPWIEDEDDAKELIEWTESYAQRTRQEEIDLMAIHPNVRVHIFHSREEVNSYINLL